MIHSLYEYYVESELTLEEILSDYVENFYLKKYSVDKASKVIKKAIDGDGMKELRGNSIKVREVSIYHPKYQDFIKAIKQNLWFSLQSDRTKALAVLAAADNWNKDINHKFLIVDEDIFRDNILLIFKEYKMMENITKRHHFSESSRSLHDYYKAEKERKAKGFEIGLRWFVYKTIINSVKIITDTWPDDQNLHPLILDKINKHRLSSLKMDVEYADGGYDIKRIAENLGLNWDRIVEDEIKFVLYAKDNAFLSYLNKNDDGTSDWILFLQDFDRTLKKKLGIT